MSTGELNDGLTSHPGGSGNTLSLSRDKLRPDGPLGSNADFTFSDLVVEQKGKIEKETVYQLVTNLQRQKSLQKGFQTQLGIT